MALFSECMPSCAQNVLDTADIVRDGDFSTASLDLEGQGAGSVRISLCMTLRLSSMKAKLEEKKGNL